MYKINFKLSPSSYYNLNRYAKSLNLSIQTIIRFLLTEQLQCYEFNREVFNENYKIRRNRSYEGKIDYYGNYHEANNYSMEVSEYIYENIQLIRDTYKDNTNNAINKLLDIAIDEKLVDFDKNFSAQYKDVKKVNTKQYAIPLSENFSQRLNDISKKTGIKTNKLISLIIGNYLIEHYDEYFDGLYESESGKMYDSVW